jgi:hypothetical protein
MRWSSLLVVACGFAGAVASAAAQLTPQAGNAFANKVIAVQKHADAGVKSPLATTFTQDETNSYLKYNATDLLPTGLTQPEITLVGDSRVAGKAIVDLDIVRQKSSSGGWLDPTSYLTGKLLVTASGKVSTGDGKGRVELERAEVSGIPIPKSFVNQMVNFFTRTADNPKGSTVDDVFDLPAKIRSITVAQGKFTTHQ